MATGYEAHPALPHVETQLSCPANGYGVPPDGVGTVTGWAGSWACRVVPWPGGLRTEIVPPRASPRSLRPIRREPRPGVGCAHRSRDHERGDGYDNGQDISAQNRPGRHCDHQIT